MRFGYLLTAPDSCVRLSVHGGSLFRCAPGAVLEAPEMVWVRIYDDPLVAVMMDPVHCQFGSGARLWKVAWSGANNNDNGLCRYVQECVVLEEVQLPTISVEQRIRAAIYCVQAVLPTDTIPAWTAWADGWLSGNDRTRKTAETAMLAAEEMESVLEFGANELAATAAAEAAVAATVDAVGAEMATARSVEAAVTATTRLLDLPEIIRRAINEEK